MKITITIHAEADNVEQAKDILVTAIEQIMAFDSLDIEVEGSEE